MLGDLKSRLIAFWSCKYMVEWSLFAQLIVIKIFHLVQGNVPRKKARDDTSDQDTEDRGEEAEEEDEEDDNFFDLPFNMSQSFTNSR